MILTWDEKNEIVDMYVEEDVDCPVPFMSDNDTVAHEGLDIDDFIDELNTFFGLNGIRYMVERQ